MIAWCEYERTLQLIFDSCINPCRLYPFVIPVSTTLPETKIRSTTLGSFIRKMRPGKSSGSYCARAKGNGKFACLNIVLVVIDWRKPYTGEKALSYREALQTDGELNITGPHNVLNLEVLEGSIEAKLLDDFGILQLYFFESNIGQGFRTSKLDVVAHLACCSSRVLFRLGSSANLWQYCLLTTVLQYVYEYALKSLPFSQKQR